MQLRSVHQPETPERSANPSVVRVDLKKIEPALGVGDDVLVEEMDDRNRRQRQDCSIKQLEPGDEEKTFRSARSRCPFACHAEGFARPQTLARRPLLNSRRSLIIAR